MLTLQASEQHKDLMENIALEPELQQYNFKIVIAETSLVELEIIVNNRKLVYPLIKDYDYIKVKAWLISALKVIEQEDNRDELLASQEQKEGNVSQVPNYLAAGIGGGLLLGSIIGLSIYTIKSRKAIDASPGGNRVNIDTDSSEESL